MTLFRPKKFLLSSLFLLGLFLVPQKTFAVGISPSELIFEAVLPNTVIETNVYFSRGNPYQTDRALITITGEASPYISPFYGTKGEIIELPQGEQITVYPIKIKTGNLGTGTYTAKVTINLLGAATSEDEGEEDTTTEGATSGTSVLAGAQGVVRFTVTNTEIEDYSIDTIQIQDSEENQLVGFSYQMSNTGNVDTRPDRVEIVITSNFDPSFLYTETIPGSELSIVPSFTAQNLTILTGAALKTDVYTAKITFYDKNNEVVREVVYPLQVYPEGTLAQKGEMISFSSDKEAYELGELVVFTANFKNTGTVGLSASLVVEISLGDKKVELLKTDPTFIPIGQTLDLLTSFRPTDRGDYSAKAYVTFAIHETEPVTVEFKVGKPPIVAITLSIILGLLLLAFIVWLLERKRETLKAHKKTKKLLKKK